MYAAPCAVSVLVGACDGALVGDLVGALDGPVGALVGAMVGATMVVVAVETGMMKMIHLRKKKKKHKTTFHLTLLWQPPKRSRLSLTWNLLD